MLSPQQCFQRCTASSSPGPPTRTRRSYPSANCLNSRKARHKITSRYSDHYHARTQPMSTSTASVVTEKLCIQCIDIFLTSWISQTTQCCCPLALRSKSGAIHPQFAPTPATTLEDPDPLSIASHVTMSSHVLPCYCCEACGLENVDMTLEFINGTVTRTEKLTADSFIFQNLQMLVTLTACQLLPNCRLQSLSHRRSIFKTSDAVAS